MVRANGMFTIVVSLSNHKLRMNGVEGLSMSGEVKLFQHISVRPEPVSKGKLSVWATALLLLTLPTIVKNAGT